MLQFGLQHIVGEHDVEELTLEGEPFGRQLFEVLLEVVPSFFYFFVFKHLAQHCAHGLALGRVGGKDEAHGFGL